MSLRALPIAVSSLLLAATAAGAAEDGGRYTLERFTPAADHNGILDVEGAQTLPAGELEMTLWLGYENDPLALYRKTADGLVREGALVGPRVGANVVAGFGLLDWLELAVDIPVVVFQTRGALPDELPLSPLAPAGLGDVRLSPRLLLLRQDDHVVDLAVVPTVTLPTSLPRASTGGDYLGEKFFTAAPEVVVGKTLFGARFLGGAGYRARSFSRVGGVVVGHEAFYDVGIGLPLQEVGLDVPVRVQATVDGAVTVLPVVANTPVEAKVGAVVDLGAVDVIAAAGAGVVGGPGVPDFRVLFAVRGGFDFNDGDRDVVDNSVDKCADAAEDRDGIADDDGCPEEDGDLDGIADVDDKCPAVAEDQDGFEDQDGCRDDDNDGDSVVDADDKCPRQPGEPDYGGCRPPDKDGDRVADDRDECPDVSAPGRKNGCPLVTAVPVEVKGEKIEFGERFLFGFDSAKILPSSTKLIDSIAFVLIDHPEVTHVRIEGHTDDTGFHAHNITLSKLRANAVRDALIKRGIAPERLTAEGFGAARPLVDGTSEEARAQNRRVELVVVHDP